MLKYLCIKYFWWCSLSLFASPTKSYFPRVYQKWSPENKINSFKIYVLHSFKAFSLGRVHNGWLLNWNFAVFFFLFVFVLWNQGPLVVQAGMDLLASASWVLALYWENYRCVPLHLAAGIYFKETCLSMCLTTILFMKSWKQCNSNRKVR